MTMDILDAISELQITLEKEAAILESFMNSYTNKPQKDIMLAVETSTKQYIYTAHVISDLMIKAKEQAAELDRIAGAEWEEQKAKAQPA